MAPNLEQLAAELERSRDFKVLRRLQRLRSPAAGPEPANALNITFVDCETTGLDPESDKVIDVGALSVRVDGNTGELVRVLGDWTGLQDPGFPIPASITALTGIADSMVASQSFDVESFRQATANTDLVIAHNAPFDRRFLERQFEWLQDIPWACSQRLIDWQAEGMGSTKLEFIAFRAGFFYGGHRALVDCHALAQALFTLRLPSTGAIAMQQILQRYGEPEYIVSANAAPFDAKDVLKGRGYRWDGDERVWRLTMAAADSLQDEFDWLRSSVYSQRPGVRVQVETRDALTRYSDRSALVEWRSIGPQGDSGRAIGTSGRRIPY